MRALTLFKVIFLFVYSQSVSASVIGFSGMEQMDANSYLIVTDKKVRHDGYRMGILRTVEDDKPVFSPLNIANWKHPDGQANDLESICRIPNKSNEFLLAEARYSKGKFGRIFHIEIGASGALVKNVFHLPKIMDGEKIAGNNFEGMVCLKKGNTTFVILGERGGSSSYRNGRLYIGVLDYAHSQLSWQEYLDKSVEIVAPGTWNNTQAKRSISDLYLDQNGIIWAVATEDAGDEGPFRSLIYQAASVSGQSEITPISAVNSKKAYWVIDGFKIESIAGPSAAVPDSYMSIATEDESYNGAWRPLFAPIE